MREEEREMEIIWTADEAVARERVAAGYEPVECSFGSAGSVIGALIMDHHGECAQLEGVALRAYRDHFGARKADPCFVVTGAGDADACFAIAALAGLLPHPSRAAELEKAPPPVKAAGTRDLTKLAELVNLVDTAPIGVRCEETEEGVMLLLWNQMSSSVQDATSFHAGVDRWRCLLGRAPKALLAAAKTEEATRVAEARKAEVVLVIRDEHSFCPYCNGSGEGDAGVAGCPHCGGSNRESFVAVVESPVWGFDVWYAEEAPIVVAYVAANGNVTVGVRDAPTAERFFGPGGLKNVFAKLEPQGWGGREAIGGSPRGMKLTREQAGEAAKVIAASVVAPDDAHWATCDGYCPEGPHQHPRKK